MVVPDTVVVVPDTVVVVPARVVVVPARVVVVGVVLQLGWVIVLSSKVTEPFRASTRPATLALVLSEAEVSARMLPTNVVSVASVAELPTCQNTLHSCAPPMSLTVLLDAVIRVDPAWKMNTPFVLPCASRVTVPVRPMALAALYTPGARVWPPRSFDTTVNGVRPAASLYAVFRSDWACRATPSAMCFVPLITFPGGKPVTALPGSTPRSPAMTEGPVLVTVWPANTANDAALPSPTGAWAADATPTPTALPRSTMPAATASSAAHRRRRRIES